MKICFISSAPAVNKASGMLKFIRISINSEKENNLPISIEEKNMVDDITSRQNSTFVDKKQRN